MRTLFAIACVAGLAVGGCSINDDLREFQNSVPARVSGLAWPALVPLGTFAQLTPIETAPDQRTIAARAAALRRKAAALRGRHVLTPARARAMRAALTRFNG